MRRMLYSEGVSVTNPSCIGRAGLGVDLHVGVHPPPRMATVPAYEIVAFLGKLYGEVRVFCVLGIHQNVLRFKKGYCMGSQTMPS